MIALRRAADRGVMRNAWLDARFTFSFASYRDPAYPGYSDLLVLNDDVVAPGGGFAPHSHTDIEAISYVLEGEVEHRDSVGNVARMRPGDVQRMTAGSGITHSEMNASMTHLEHHLQFWIAPAVRGLPPGYEQRSFPQADKRGRLRLVVSPDGRDGSLSVHQDMRLHATIVQDDPVEYAPPTGRRTYLHVARGAASVNGRALGEADGAFIEGEQLLFLMGAPEAEILIFDLR